MSEKTYQILIFIAFYYNTCLVEIIKYDIFFTLETRMQQLLEGFFFVKKGLGVHVQIHAQYEYGLYTG